MSRKSLHRTWAFLILTAALLTPATAPAAERRPPARSEAEVRLSWSPVLWLQQAGSRLTALWEALGGSVDPLGNTALTPPPEPEPSNHGGSLDPYG